MLAHLRDTTLYFDIDGMGLVPDGARLREQPPAFVIHGGPGGEHSDLKAGFGPLSDALQLVYFDHRGQGRSGRGDVRRYNLDENVEDMEALRRHLGLGPIVSMGTSYGGMVAMAHAARYPESVSHLVLMVTASHAGFNARARQIVAERGTPEQVAVCEDLWAGRIDTVEKMLRYYALTGPLYALKFDPAAAALGRQRAIYSPEAMLQAFAPGGFLQTFDLRPELARITARTLILAGRHDWICPPEFSEEIHRLIPGSQLQVLENSSHSLRVDEPEAMREAIRRFLPASGTAPQGAAR